MAGEAEGALSAPVWDFPERVARRLHQRYQLAPRIDVLSLARRHATVRVDDFPIDADGVCLDANLPGRSPVILINKAKPRQRRRFTLAHELGHVLMPWHRGTVVDDAELARMEGDDHDARERQANRFASELLMPRSWVASVIAGVTDPGVFTRQVAERADVSFSAALFAVLAVAPAGYVYALTDENGLVTSSGSSPGTAASSLARNVELVGPEAFEPARLVTYWPPVISEARRAAGCHWWLLSPRTTPRRALCRAADGRSWRRLLKDIQASLRLSSNEAKRVEGSLSGFFGKTSPLLNGGGAEEYWGAVWESVATRAAHDDTLAHIVAHPDFETFGARRVEAVLAERARRGSPSE